MPLLLSKVALLTIISRKYVMKGCGRFSFGTVLQVPLELHIKFPLIVDSNHVEGECRHDKEFRQIP